MIQKIILIFVQGIKSKSIFHFFYKLKNLFLYFKYISIKNEVKIIYALTPPAQLSNIGDHAQVIAIHKWFNDYYKGLKVIEFNKDETLHLQWTIKNITNKSDLIFIHSGGNMGDSGLWSERGRRLMIKNFPKNKIVSLPQTIYFSDTEMGRNELETSKKIYNVHKNLTIVARDFQSEKLAQQYFPNSKILACPDFVLFLHNSNLIGSVSGKREGVTFCLRNDIESVLDNEKRNQIISSSNGSYQVIDTTLPRLISRKNRKKELAKTLNLIGASSIMVTDRFHGLIFAVLTKTPCIVLATINHKLVSAFDWFSGINYVKLANDIEDIPDLMNELIELPGKNDKDWTNLFFEPIKDKL